MENPERSRCLVAVRRAVADDAEQIRALAVDNGLFAPDEMDAFDELIDGYLDGAVDGHCWLVAAGQQTGPVGAAYYAPEPFADRVWNLYFLAVHPQRHRDGIGGALLAHVEQALRGAGEQVARVLIVETSSTDSYDVARRFYQREGFHREARIREFYGPGDDKVVFWKSLLGQVTTTSRR